MGTSTKGIAPTATVSITKMGAVYRPKQTTAQGNAATWGTVQAALKKPQTVASLTALVAKQHNHAPFVGYAIRRGWLQAS